MGQSELAVAPLVHLLLNFLLYTGRGSMLTTAALAVVNASDGQLYAALSMALTVSVIIGTHCHLE